MIVFGLQPTTNTMNLQLKRWNATVSMCVLFKQFWRTEGAIDVHHPIPTAVTGELDQVSLFDLLQDPDWGISTFEYNVDNDTTRYADLSTPVTTNMSILRVGPNELSTRTVRDNPTSYQPQGAATSHLSKSQSRHMLSVQSHARLASQRIRFNKRNVF